MVMIVGWELSGLVENRWVDESRWVQEEWGVGPWREEGMDLEAGKEDGEAIE